MVKICSNGLYWGYNSHYNDPKYIEKQRIAHYKGYDNLKNKFPGHAQKRLWLPIY